MGVASRLYELDQQLSAKLRVAEKPGSIRNVAILLAHSGDSWFWLFGLAVLWYLGDGYWRSRAVAYAVGILVTAMLVMAVKFTGRRRRPEGEWGGIYRRTDPHSFPSGHAARAVMLAAIAAGLGPPWFGVFLWIWAPLVVLARVAMGLHFVSAVLVGALFGLVLGVIILQFLPLAPF